jgi:hypothetical protein
VSKFSGVLGDCVNSNVWFVAQDGSAVYNVEYEERGL